LHWAPTEHLDAHEQAKVARLVNDHFVYLDWGQTTAYAQSSATNGVHIRVAGEGRKGGVPLERLDAFRQELTDRLLEVRDPETGTPIVTHVLSKEEAYAGKNNRFAPDLTLTLFDHGFVSILDKEPVVWKRPEVVGTHCPEGVFAARGPGIRRGHVLPQQSIVQMAATLMYSLGLPVPCDFEGDVIRGAFATEFLAGRPVLSGPPTEPLTSCAAGQRAPSQGAPRNDSSSEEDRAVIERLRALGYVE
jgi:predicted AlkP superfamily phosphohydrolase/phosphomutase